VGAIGKRGFEMCANYPVHVGLKVDEITTWVAYCKAEDYLTLFKLMSKVHSL